MNTARIAIVGGGLSGLHAALCLLRAGVQDFVLLEARTAPGGRISSAGGFDLGPTWYWPEFQPELHELIVDLGLRPFAQFEEGDLLVEQAQQGVPMRVPGYASAPAAMRLPGGMQSLVEALQQRIPDRHLRGGHRVRRMRRVGEQVELDCEPTSWRVDHVMLALSPRLAEATIGFTPALPPALARSWRETPTWMAPHAKYVAVYDHAFWREAGLSGGARSARGPLGEIHDASVPQGPAALFGFLGVPAQVRRRVPQQQLLQHCKAQLTRLFGPRAAHPREEFFKDWSVDPFTSTAADEANAGHALRQPETGAIAGPWYGRLTGIASEWSAEFPGYLAGAVDASRRGVDAWLSSCPSNKPSKECP
ncbi:FAD-dependent oxidoreductase [Paucibacter sp. R3-3]|uniref:FAD-dependent oxidoreductase n=1 Tax=Roseateles agri TaxID=3098619 RepID=A0ABU5DEF2_9BURK|nr:FAD-dependent oxidoreductase [Paucibacter sp. R3-3]MDY0744664.1 FAD-dependent oxidoreductase [Paucibacter sp. R3-3]